MFIFPTDLELLELLFQVQVVRPMTIGGRAPRSGWIGEHLQTDGDARPYYTLTQNLSLKSHLDFWDKLDTFKQFSRL